MNKKKKLLMKRALLIKRVENNLNKLLKKDKNGKIAKLYFEIIYGCDELL